MSLFLFLSLTLSSIREMTKVRNTRQKRVDINLSRAFYSFFFCHTKSCWLLLVRVEFVVFSVLQSHFYLVSPKLMWLLIRFFLCSWPRMNMVLQLNEISAFGYFITAIVLKFFFCFSRLLKTLLCHRILRIASTESPDTDIAEWIDLLTAMVMLIGPSKHGHHDQKNTTWAPWHDCYALCSVHRISWRITVQCALPYFHSPLARLCYAK